MTEKNYNSQQKDSKTMKKQSNAEKLKKPEAADTKKGKEEIKKEAEVKEDKKQKTGKKPVKKEMAVVNGISLPISTLDAIFIGRFIKKKTIEKAVAELGEVAKLKKVIPMTGEIPHKKGRGVMSGRYPMKAISYFIKLLKTLRANASVNGLEEPIIAEVIPNKASEPYGKSGAVRRKRTHVKIIAREKAR
jgi:ribosomal protein L22